MQHDDRLEELRRKTLDIAHDIPMRLHSDRNITKSEATRLASDFLNGIEEVERELEEVPPESRGAGFQLLLRKLQDLRAECAGMVRRIKRWSTTRPGSGMKCGY